MFIPMRKPRNESSNWIRRMLRLLHACAKRMGRDFPDPWLLRLGHQYRVPEFLFELGVRHESMRHGMKSPAMAFTLFEQASDWGHADAAYHAGSACRCGSGVPVDLDRALAFYHRALALNPEHIDASRWKDWTAQAIRKHANEVEDSISIQWSPVPSPESSMEPASPSGRMKSALHDLRHEGRGSIYLLIVAGLLALYLVLDIYTRGIGPWRPDPRRVVWGLFGTRIYATRDGSAERVIPKWMRPDFRNIKLIERNLDSEGKTSKYGNGSSFRLDDLRGKIVCLHVFQGLGPMFHESIEEYVHLDQSNPDVAVILLYLPPMDRPDIAMATYQEVSGRPLCTPAAPDTLRPLGKIQFFPMTYILDRRGRLRQAWAGYGKGIAQQNVIAALNES